MGGLLSSERGLPVTVLLVSLPWIAAMFYAPGIRGTLNFAGYAILVFAAGYGVVTLMLPAPTRPALWALAPAAGILAVSALTAFWARMGLPLLGALGLWVGLLAVGIWGLWRDRASWSKGTVTCGFTLAVLSALVCAVYFLPTARNNLVSRPDGSYSWKFVDAQHFHAMAASIKESGSPPKTPGTFTAELLYHFGPYAPAAAISKLDGLDLGDAVARVTHGASLWALVLSCFGLGTLLSRKATGQTFGGIASVAGLFFYGSLAALFTTAGTTTGHAARAMLFNVPGVQVLADGGPFDQLLVGHSVQHGLGAITVIMGLCLAATGCEPASAWRGIPLLVLPALAVPVNSVAALYCLGVVGTLLFWGRLWAVRSWLSITLMLCLFFGAWHIMGYGHAPDAAHAALNEHCIEQWWTLAVWLTVGLGFRIVGLRWISRPWNEPLSGLVLVTVLGLLAFALLLNLRDSNERYGFYFLQSLFSIFAFSRVTSGCWHGEERRQMTAEWLGLVTKTMAVFVVGAMVLRVAVRALHRDVWIASVSLQIVPGCLLILLLSGALVLMTRRRGWAAVGSTVFMGVLLVGFLAWVPVFVRYGLGTIRTGVTYPAGEVRGLRRLGEFMRPDERFATNKHALDSISLTPPYERSYGYSALAEHPVLLEGYLDRGENLLPGFDALLRDNDLLFTTTEPEMPRGIARTYGVRWLVARPGTDISLNRPLPSWLVEQHDCGDLKIYRID
jgi:hypothetical protein